MKNRKDIIQKLKTKMDGLTEQQKTILDFAGAWEDLDQSTFDDFTKNLHKNRLEESGADDTENSEK